MYYLPHSDDCYLVGYLVLVVVDGCLHYVDDSPELFHVSLIVVLLI